MKDLSKQVILITGSTDGLGKAVAIEFAKKGATVLLQGRNPEKGHAVLNEIQEITENEKLSYYNADFSSLKEVQVLADEVLDKNSKLDMLINNAGIGGDEQKNTRELSKEGFELRFTVNYLAPFLLTMRLLPLLKKCAPSQIVNVSSGAQEAIDFDDVMLEKNYNGSRAYAQSKLALVMFTFSLAQELKNTQVNVNCLHPASMMDTKLVRKEGGEPRTSVKEGVDTIVYVATSPDTEHITGIYFDHHKPTKAEPQVYASKARDKLYELSLKLTGV